MWFLVFLLWNIFIEAWINFSCTIFGDCFVFWTILTTLSPVGWSWPWPLERIKCHNKRVLWFAPEYSAWAVFKDIDAYIILPGPHYQIHGVQSYKSNNLDQCAKLSLGNTLFSSYCADYSGITMQVCNKIKYKEICHDQSHWVTSYRVWCATKSTTQMQQLQGIFLWSVFDEINVSLKS